MGNESYKDQFYRWVADHLPRRLIYYCMIRVMVHATTGKWSNEIVGKVSIMEALDRWEKKQ